jgi:hypothetical protein
MKRFFALLLIALTMLFATLPVAAADGNVTYSGDAGKFIFKPGTTHSPTDLFPDFKGVMPGDTLTQKITVKNDASQKVKVMIYMRSLGAHEDSREFLSQLHLRVKKSEGNSMPYMFDAAANETAGLTEWNYLGMLYSGGTVDLEVELTVPAELDNKYSDQIGKLDWEFMIEELPAEPSDPVPPTGDSSNPVLWACLLIVSAFVMILVVFLQRKKEKEEKEPASIK